MESTGKSSPSPHRADLHTLFERGELVGALGDEFLAEVAGVTGFLDGFDDRGVVQLLRLVDLGAAGDAASVVVGEEFVIAADGGDDITLHDLHVVDVVEQLEVR